MGVEVAAGDVLGGKFRVERIVGRGGMGVVIEATNTQLDQKVALKLLARGADDPSTVERFTHEAKAAARLRSEHVARVFDVGKDPVHGPFIVMEMLDGQTLADVLTTSGRVPSHRAVEHVIDACEGLAEAHARGIVHQDVKPANLFLVTGDDGRPTVKLLDFGIATVRGPEAAAKDKDGKSSAPRSQGTPAYLSPEQLRGGSAPIDHRADVWSLGCVLYELLANEKPFRATRFTELVTKILETSPEPLPSDVDVPPALAAVILRCLEKDRTKRFSSTGQLALALLPFARRRAHSSVSRAVAHVKTGGLDPDLEMPSSMPPPPDSEPSISRPGSDPRLRAPSVPDISLAPRPLASAAPAPAPAPAKSRLPLAIALLFGTVALGGGAFAITRGASTTPVAPTVSAPTTPTEITNSAAAEPAPAPSPAASPEPAPEATTSAAATSATPIAIPVKRPVVRPRPTASSAAPIGTEAEIRHTR
ncbi:MAG: serine/threonine protein kinase [Labilithrix sp.]|nr:serine/threonine protein kinase [Labilithrix sp.]MCW5812173.1 serine/threonine protein kinase [Labilithrix sp.]